MDWNLLAQSYYQFGVMFVLFSIGMATVVAVIDSLPIKVRPLVEQH